MPVPDYLKHLSEEFVARAEECGFSGKRRDELALEFFLGAAASAGALGREDVRGHLLKVAAFLIATRGFSEVKRIALEEEET